MRATESEVAKRLQPQLDRGTRVESRQQSDRIAQRTRGSVARIDASVPADGLQHHDTRSLRDQHRRYIARRSRRDRVRRVVGQRQSYADGFTRIEEAIVIAEQL